MLSALNQIENTGGFKVTFMKGITDFFGVTPQSMSSFSQLAARSMLDDLAAFKGSISDGEREATMALQAADRGEGINREIVERFIKEQLLKAERLEFLMLSDTDTIDKYNEFMVNQYKDEPKTGGKLGVIKWSDLKD